jgi:hypothetical protein
VERLLERVPSLLYQRRICIEPCVGDGSILRGFPPDEMRKWFVNDIEDRCVDPGSQRIKWSSIQDAREILRSISDRPSLCITNPPFRIAHEILMAAHARCEVVAFLLRVGFPRSPRDDWFRAHRPNVYLLPDRPVFDGENGDSTEYAWFVWGVSPAPFDVLDRTPRAIRARAEEEARAMLNGLVLNNQQLALF